MPPSALGARHNTSQGILGRGSNNQSRTRNQDSKSKKSTCTKHSLVYELIPKKKKKSAQEHCKEKKRSQIIRTFLVSDTSPTTSTDNRPRNTAVATNNATVTTTEDHNHILNNNNKTSFSVQHALLSKGISCRVGDK
eukprot:14738723-Ditylum_brightwellii.AAC.1